MRALVLADRDPHFNVADLARAEQVDAVLLLGDLNLWTLQSLRELALPKLGVHGNHDYPGGFEDLGIEDMHLKARTVGGLTFGGFEGCIAYKPIGNHLYRQQDVRRLIASFPAVDVFLSHSPPRGINDEPLDEVHVGFDGLREYLDRHHPRVWLHGHTSPAADELVRAYGPTRIEYVYGHRIVDLGEPARASDTAFRPGELAVSAPSLTRAQRLAQLSQRAGCSVDQVIDNALDAYERQLDAQRPLA